MEQWAGYLREQEAQAREMVLNAAPAHWWEMLGQASFWMTAAAMIAFWLACMPKPMKDFIRRTLFWWD
jgi:hypothetical protein